MTKSKKKTKKVVKAQQKPKKIKDSYYDFLEVMHYLEKKTGRDFQDYAGRWSKEGQKDSERALQKWLKENGYGDKAHVLDVPDPKKPDIDWPENSKEMKLRIKIREQYRVVEEQLIRPYQNFWHWIVQLNEVFNGCFIHLPDLALLDDPQVEDWKKEIMQHFYKFLRGDYHERMWCAW